MASTVPCSCSAGVGQGKRDIRPLVVRSFPIVLPRSDLTHPFYCRSTAAKTPTLQYAYPPTASLEEVSGSPSSYRERDLCGAIRLQGFAVARQEEARQDLHQPVVHVDRVGGQARVAGAVADEGGGRVGVAWHVADTGAGRREEGMGKAGVGGPRRRFGEGPSARTTHRHTMFSSRARIEVMSPSASSLLRPRRSGSPAGDG